MRTSTSSAWGPTMRRAWSARADCTSTRPLPPNCLSSTSLCECSALRRLSWPAPLRLDSLLAIQMRRRRVFRRGADDNEADRGDEHRIYWASTNIDGGMRAPVRSVDVRGRYALVWPFPASVLVSLLLTACSAPMPQMALNPHSDY